MNVRARVTAIWVVVCCALPLAIVVPAAAAGATATKPGVVMPSGPSTTTTIVHDGAKTATVTFTAGGSVNQVYTYGHAVGTPIDLLDSGGNVVQSGVADAQGALLFQKVAKGTGYVVREGGTGGPESNPLTVTNPDDNPPQSFYDNIKLHSGFGYLPTRDGTLLSVNITFPTDGSKGPWPVVMDYSGYDPSQPGSPPQEAAFYPYRGYVTVGVNMRGTTCSGGAFNFFEPLQSTDGYDAVEALAAQSWSNGNVGLVGISYSGYSQLYVAATDPPHLRAITPLSPFGDTYRGILYPGGILNNGFALGWATDRQNASRPANDGWVKDRIAGGDTTCAQNQVMRLQSQNLLAEIKPGRDDDPAYSYLDTTTFVNKIDVPVYLASQFQDEQTGGSAMDLAAILDKHPDFKAVFTNGTHVESLGPTELPRVLEFIDFYVGHVIPKLGPLLRVGVPPALEGIFGGPITLPLDRFSGYTSYDAALAAYQAEPPIRIRWENGGKKGLEGSPYSVDDTSYPSWPIPTVTPERWYLEPDGQLSSTPPTVSDNQARGSSSYTYDPSTRPVDTFGGSSDSMWLQHPAVNWEPLSEGNSLSFTTPAYTTAKAYAGYGSVDLWVKSSAADTDFEAELTQVYPDGHEQLIQSGWLRASRRQLDPARSTVLQPYETQLAQDEQPLPSGKYVEVRIPTFAFAEIVKPGARLRLNIQAPGGNQPYWAFADLPGTSTDTIAHSAGYPSSVALPLLPTDNSLQFVTSALGTPNPCVVVGATTQSVSDRGQPCRPYEPAREATGVTATSLGGTAVSVSWTAPPTWPNGAGGPLTGYEVIEAPTGKVLHVGPGTTSVDFVDVPVGTNLTYTVRAEYGSDLAPASDASLSVFIPVVVKVPALGPPPETDAERFVRAVYPALLGRPVDDGALAYWEQKLAAGTSRTQVALHLVASDEYRRTEVLGAYQAILARKPTARELAGGVTLLRAGVSLASFRSGLLGSAEFWSRSGATAAGFAHELYAAVLHRSPTLAELGTVEVKLAKGSSRRAIALALLDTAAGRARVVSSLFRLLLDRGPTTAETKAYAQQLAVGRAESTVAAELAGSAEFLAKA